MANIERMNEVTVVIRGPTNRKVSEVLKTMGASASAVRTKRAGLRSIVLPIMLLFATFRIAEAMDFAVDDWIKGQMKFGRIHEVVKSGDEVKLYKILFKVETCVEVSGFQDNIIGNDLARKNFKKVTSRDVLEKLMPKGFEESTFAKEFRRLKQLSSTTGERVSDFQSEGTATENEDKADFCSTQNCCGQPTLCDSVKSVIKPTWRKTGWVLTGGLAAAMGGSRLQQWKVQADHDEKVRLLKLNEKAYAKDGYMYNADHSKIMKHEDDPDQLMEKRDFYDIDNWKIFIILGGLLFVMFCFMSICTYRNRLSLNAGPVHPVLGDCETAATGGVNTHRGMVTVLKDQSSALSASAASR